MNIDWDKEPKAVGALVAKISNIHYPNITFVSEFHTFGCMFRGTSCEGQALSASNDCWDWIPRPVPAWSGEGLPPVGTVCEMLRDTYFKMDWQAVTFLCSGSKKAFFRDKDGDEWSRPLSELTFRHIRTPEQIAAEERDEASVELAGILAGHDQHIAVRDIEMAKYLYDIGYRKEVKS